MPDKPENYRNVKLLAGANGSGFILEYDLMGRRDNEPLGGLVFLREVKEVFDIDEGKAALKKLMVFSGSIAPAPENNPVHEDA